MLQIPEEVDIREVMMNSDVTLNMDDINLVLSRVKTGFEVSADVDVLMLKDLPGEDPITICPGYDNKLHPVVALRRGVNEVNLCYNYLQVTLGQGVVTCMPPRQGYVGAVVHWNALPVKGSSIVVVLVFYVF